MRTKVKCLLAVIIAVVLGLPGILWGQGTQSRGRYADSPRQADKSFATNQQKKRQIGNKGKKLQPQKKGQPAGKGPATQSQPPTKAMRGGPTSK
jgi:uncharacterized protein HemX